MAFDHLNEQRDAARQENETQAKQKKQQQSSESHISSETVNGYLNLFDYISLLQKEIDRQDKEIENQYYKITANEQKLQTQKREEEYKQREHALANRIQQDRSSQALQNIPGSTLAGAIQAQTGMNMPSSGDMQYGDGMAPASTQHQQMTAASNASMGPQRPVMSQRRQESNAAPRYIPDNHQQVPVNSWTRSSRNQVNAGHPVQDASHPAVQHEQRQPGRAPAAGNVKQGTVNSSVRMNQPQMPVQSGNVNNNVMSGMVPDYAGGRNIGGYIPESQNGGDYAEQFDDVPMPEYRDFASDSDDEADRANSVDYTSLDLTPSVQNGGSAPSSDAQKNVHHRRKINGREIRMPMDLLGQVSDSYTQDLVAAGVSMENLVILNRGIREFGANENEWIIRLPKVIDGILNRNALSDMAAEISAGLGRKISLKFDFVDAGEIEGSPEALDNQFYEQNLESEKRSIVESEGFAEVQNMLGLDIGEAKIELVQTKTKDQS